MCAAKSPASSVVPSGILLAGELRTGRLLFDKAFLHGTRQRRRGSVAVQQSAQPFTQTLPRQLAFDASRYRQADRARLLRDDDGDRVGFFRDPDPRAMTRPQLG